MANVADQAVLRLVQPVKFMYDQIVSKHEQPTSFRRWRQIAFLSAVCWVISGSLSCTSIPDHFAGQEPPHSTIGMQIFALPDRNGSFSNISSQLVDRPFVEITGQTRRFFERKGVLPGFRTTVEWSAQWRNVQGGQTHLPTLSDVTVRWIVIEHLSIYSPLGFNPTNLTFTPGGFTRWDFDGHGIIRAISFILFLLGLIGLWISANALREVGKRLRVQDAAENPTCPHCRYPLVQNLCPECGHGALTQDRII